MFPDMHRGPLTVAESHGVPLLNWKLLHLRLTQFAAEPTNSNLILSNVPLPESGAAPNAETVSLPGVLLLGVMVIPSLIVPVLSTGRFCKRKAVASKVSVKS